MLEVVVTVDMEEVVGEVMAVVVMVDMEVALEVMVVVVMADMAEEVMEVDLMAEVVALMVGDMEEEDMVVVGGMEEALEVAQQLWSSKCPRNGPLRTDYYQRLLYSGGQHVPVTLVLVRKDK